MLEFTYYNTEKFSNLKDFFTVSFVLIRKRLLGALLKAYQGVETSFSQLSERININRVLEKNKCGLTLRITLKILAHNLSFALNAITGNIINVGEIKHLIFC